MHSLTTGGLLCVYACCLIHLVLMSTIYKKTIMCKFIWVFIIFDNSFLLVRQSLHCFFKLAGALALVWEKEALHAEMLPGSSGVTANRAEGTNKRTPPGETDAVKTQIATKWTRAPKVQHEEDKIFKVFRCDQQYFQAQSETPDRSTQ